MAEKPPPIVICVDCGVEDGCDCDTVPIEDDDEVYAPCTECGEAVCDCLEEPDLKKSKVEDEKAEEEEEREFSFEVGKCCFCGDYCNPCSQACGPCVRNGPMFQAYFESIAAEGK
jgi:hypothetical protein